jgi:acetylserotonin O-methyltransferase
MPNVIPTATPDPAPVLSLIDAFRSSKVMFTAVSMGVFDSLEREPRSAQSLSIQLQAQTEPVERLLDACVGLGLLSKQGGTYHNHPVASTYLCLGSPDTLAGYILYSDKMLFQLWAHLEDAIREGQPQWKQAFQVEGNIFEHFFRTDRDMKVFLQGMHGLGRLSSPRVVSAFDLSRFRKFIDLGGATGHLAIAACERYPQLSAILFDLPRVIDSVREEISRCSVASRIEFQRGDFFQPEQLPEGDLFALGRILHDWTDAKAGNLLRAIYDHLPSGGGVLLAERILNEDKSGPISAQLQSLNMLVCTEGKERTLSEFRALFEAAGFTNVQGYVTGAPLDAVFAVKA